MSKKAVSMVLVIGNVLLPVFVVDVIRLIGDIHAFIIIFLIIFKFYYRYIESVFADYVNSVFRFFSGTGNWKNVED